MSGYARFVEPGPHFRKHLYFQLPHMVTGNYVELVRDLMAVKLDDLPSWAEDYADELARLADEAEARLTRLGSDLPRENVEVEVERQTDDVGSMISTSFEYWELITNPHLRQDPKPGDEVERAKQDDLANRARMVNRAMFGDDGLEFMRMSYPDRFRSCTAMIRMLREDPELLELLHKPVGHFIEYLGEGYEQLVTKHMRERNELRGLGDHRVALRWALTVYASEIGGLADRWSEDSCARVNASLQPYVDWVRRMKQQH